MMTDDFRNFPIDAASASLLKERGLRFALVDTGDRSAFEQWILAEGRGFHEPNPSAESLRQQVSGLADQRTTGVWDDTLEEPAAPVATVGSWPTELTVPGSVTIPAWAISAVTVSPTHRRRGIAKALLESELRTAHALGIPVAALTVSESTIYSRFGFAPAALSADFSIDTRRAAWTGPTASGRVQFVSPESLRTDGRALIERMRPHLPGEVAMRDYKWERTLGLVGEPEPARGLRMVRYDDSDGRMRGFAVYRVTETGPHHAAQVLELQYLLAATGDSHAGLWAYLLQLDLVGTITANLRPVDEPLAWQLSDFRAVRKTEERDHLWTRILDPKAALEARRYAASGRVALQVSDPLGFAEGRMLVDIDSDGAATVTPLTGDAPADAAELALTVNELSAVYLGAMSWSTLVRTGRVVELREGSAAVADASFRTPTAPWLSFWF